MCCSYGGSLQCFADLDLLCCTLPIMNKVVHCSVLLTLSHCAAFVNSEQGRSLQCFANLGTPARPSARPLVRPSVRPPARPSVGPPVRPSVHLFFCKETQKRLEIHKCIQKRPEKPRDAQRCQQSFRDAHTHRNTQRRLSSSAHNISHTQNVHNVCASFFFSALPVQCQDRFLE